MNHSLVFFLVQPIQLWFYLWRCEYGKHQQLLVSPDKTDCLTSSLVWLVKWWFLSSVEDIVFFCRCFFSLAVLNCTFPVTEKTKQTKKGARMARRQKRRDHYIQRPVSATTSRVKLDGCRTRTGQRCRRALQLHHCTFGVVQECKLWIWMGASLQPKFKWRNPKAFALMKKKPCRLTCWWCEWTGFLQTAIPAVGSKSSLIDTSSNTKNIGLSFKKRVVQYLWQDIQDYCWMLWKMRK